MAVFQISTAKTSFGNLKREISDVPTDTFIEWCNFIAIEAYHLFLGIDSEKYLKSQSYTAITGNQALPTDFDSMQYDGCGFWEVDSDGTQSDRRLTLTGFGSRSKGYYLRGDYVYFTGINGNLSVTLRYAPEFTLFDNLADYFTLGALMTDPEIIPLDHMEVVVNGLDMFYCRWDEDVAMEPAATQKYEASLMSMDPRRTAGAYSVPDYSSNY